MEPLRRAGRGHGADRVRGTAGPRAGRHRSAARDHQRLTQRSAPCDVLRRSGAAASMRSSPGLRRPQSPRALRHGAARASSRVPRRRRGPRGRASARHTGATRRCPRPERASPGTRPAPDRRRRSRHRGSAGRRGIARCSKLGGPGLRTNRSNWSTAPPVSCRPQHRTGKLLDGGVSNGGRRVRIEFLGRNRPAGPFALPFVVGALSSRTRCTGRPVACIRCAAS